MIRSDLFHKKRPILLRIFLFYPSAGLCPRHLMHVSDIIELIRQKKELAEAAKLKYYEEEEKVRKLEAAKARLERKGSGVEEDGGDGNSEDLGEGDSTYDDLSSMLSSESERSGSEREDEDEHSEGCSLDDNDKSYEFFDGSDDEVSDSDAPDSGFFNSGDDASEYDSDSGHSSSESDDDEEEDGGRRRNKK